MSDQATHMNTEPARRRAAIEPVAPLVYMIIILPGMVHALIMGGELSGRVVGAGALSICIAMVLVPRLKWPLAILVVILLLALAKTLVYGFIDPIGLAIIGYTVGVVFSLKKATVILGFTGIFTCIAFIIFFPEPMSGITGQTASVLIIFPFLAVSFIGVLVRLVTRLRKSEEAKAQAILREEKSAAEVMRVATLTSLSRDIHDIVGHSLTAIINLSDGARVSASASDVAGETLQRINHISREALSETRNVVAALRLRDSEHLSNSSVERGSGVDPVNCGTPEESLDYDMLQRYYSRTHAFGGYKTKDDIRGLLENAAAIGIKTEYQVTGEGVPCKAVRAGMWQISREAITNTMRHGVAVSELRVTIVYSEGNVTLTISDDGRKSDISTNFGYGLIGATERAESLGGVLFSGPDSDTGWVTEAIIPTGEDIEE